ncbi:hypothetical protein ACIQGQ_32000, partial [Streptomyces sp. NPDC092952]
IAKGAGTGLSKIGDITKGLKGISNIEIPKLPDNAVTLPNGSTMLPDGTFHLPDGAKIPDGGVELPGGNVKFPDDVPVIPENTTKLPSAPDNPGQYFDNDGNLLDKDGKIVQHAGDAPKEASPTIPHTDGNGPTTPHTDSTTPHPDGPAKEPALVGVGANTADNVAHAGAHTGDNVVHLGSDISDPVHLGDNLPGNHLGDNLPGSHVGDNLPTGHLGDNLPGGHAGDNLPGGHADDLGHGPNASHEPPGSHGDGPGGSHGDGPGSHGDGPGSHGDGPGSHGDGPGGHGDGPGSHGDGPGGSHGDGPGGDGPGGHGDGPGGGDGPGEPGNWDRPSHESGPMELGGKTEQLIRDQMRGSKVKPGDLDKALANLADHPSGQEMANLIASGRFKGLTNYDQVVSSFTQKNGMSGGIEQLRLAERLQNSGVTDISFEIKKDVVIKPDVTTGARTDLDVMARDADGKVYGYQFKEVANPKKVTSKMWQNIGQLADSGADVKVFVVDTKGTMADMLAQGVEKDLTRIHNEKGVTVVLRVEDGTLMYPPGSNFMPGGRP